MQTMKISGRDVIVPDDISGYWMARAHHDLYRMMVLLTRGLFAESKSAIDVGSYTAGLICEMDWIPYRIATDIQAQLAKNWSGVPGVEFVAGDAFEIDFPAPFDLVISNQTVEHLERPAEFISKLINLGRGLIVSTTYEVKTGIIAGHVQDPISLEKFQSWFPCQLDAWLVCHHPSNRLIKHIVGVVKQSHPNKA